MSRDWGFGARPSSVAQLMIVIKYIKVLRNRNPSSPPETAEGGCPVTRDWLLVRGTGHGFAES